MKYQFILVMSSVVETSFIRFFRIRFSDFVDNLHSLRSLEMTVSLNMYIVPIKISFFVAIMARNVSNG